MILMEKHKNLIAKYQAMEMELMNLCLLLHELLNEQVPDDDDEKADHDFDLIKHDSKCDYSEIR